MSAFELPRSMAELAASLLPVSEGNDRFGEPAENAAAVLVLLFPRDEEVLFLLTERPHTLARHPGQISLPGGRAEPGDGDLWQTAMREVEEELGICAEDISPLGRLEDYDLPVSGYLITPFVAWTPREPHIHADPREVAAVIEVSLTSLLDPAAVQEETWRLRGNTYDVTFYRFARWQVWGATARMLHDLACRISGVDCMAPEGPGAVRLLQPDT